jgi:hypothetical protein
MLIQKSQLKEYNMINIYHLYKKWITPLTMSVIGNSKL